MVYEPHFLDRKDFHGPFDGALVIFNLGEDDWPPEGMSQEYEDHLRESIASAYADGRVVLFLWDAAKGVSLPPECVETMPDMCFYRFLSDLCGVPVAEFPLLPRERDEEFRKMAQKIGESSEYVLAEKRFAFMGRCWIGKKEVLLPFTPLD